MDSDSYKERGFWGICKFVDIIDIIDMNFTK